MLQQKTGNFRRSWVPLSCAGWGPHASTFNKTTARVGKPGKGGLLLLALHCPVHSGSRPKKAARPACRAVWLSRQALEAILCLLRSGRVSPERKKRWQQGCRACPRPGGWNFFPHRALFFRICFFDTRPTRRLWLAGLRRGRLRIVHCRAASAAGRPCCQPGSAMLCSPPEGFLQNRAKIAS